MVIMIVTSIIVSIMTVIWWMAFEVLLSKYFWVILLYRYVYRIFWKNRNFIRSISAHYVYRIIVLLLNPDPGMRNYFLAPIGWIPWFYKSGLIDFFSKIFRYYQDMLHPRPNQENTFGNFIGSAYNNVHNNLII